MLPLGAAHAGTTRTGAKQTLEQLLLVLVGWHLFCWLQQVSSFYQDPATGCLVANRWFYCMLLMLLYVFGCFRFCFAAQCQGPQCIAGSISFDGRTVPDMCSSCMARRGVREAALQVLMVEILVPDSMVFLCVFQCFSCIFPPVR